MWLNTSSPRSGDQEKLPWRGDAGPESDRVGRRATVAGSILVAISTLIQIDMRRRAPSSRPRKPSYAHHRRAEVNKYISSTDDDDDDDRERQKWKLRAESVNALPEGWKDANYGTKRISL